MKAHLKLVKYNKEETKEVIPVETMNDLNRTFGSSDTRKEVGEKDLT